MPDKVKSTLNYDFLNEVCREIIRDALREAAELQESDLENQDERRERWMGRLGVKVGDSSDTSTA